MVLNNTTTPTNNTLFTTLRPIAKSLALLMMGMAFFVGGGKRQRTINTNLFLNKLAVFLCLLLSLLIGGKSWGQLVAWNPTTPTSITGYGSSPFTPTTTNSNLTVVGLTRGSGVGTANIAAASAWGGSMNTANVVTSAVAITANQFVTFSITPKTSYTTSLSTFDLFYRRSSTGPASGTLQYSINAGAYSDISTLSFSNTTSSGASITQISLTSISALQSVAAGSIINFRITLYGNGAVNGTFYVFSTGLQIGGTVASAASITPATTTGINLTNTTYGTPQTAQSQVISATGLSGNITVTPPVGIQVSSDNSTWVSNPSTVTNLAAGGTLYYRLDPTASIGNYINKVINLSGNSGAVTATITTTTTGTSANQIATAALTVTASAQSKTYGSTSPTSGTLNTNYTVSGLKNSDAVSGATLAYSGSPAGNLATASVAGSPYTITPSALTLSTGSTSNYSITYNTANLTVNAAPITITASAQNKPYNTAQSTPVTGSIAFTITSGSLQNSETIGSVTLTYNGAAALGATGAIGTTATITPSSATGGTFSAGNYNVSYADGVLTVVKATPSVTTTPTASAITAGQTLASSTLSGGVASVAGTFAFTTPNNSYNAGSASVLFTFTPTDGTNYNTVSGNVNVTVNPFTLDKIGLTNADPAINAYSLRLLTSNYNGPLVRIWNGSNHYDVYPDATTGGITVNSLLSAPVSAYNSPVAAAGATKLGTITSATVEIWYDQSGYGYNVYQGLNTTFQPTLISSGSINKTISGVPSLNFASASNNYLYTLSGAAWLCNTPFTIQTVAQTNNPGTTGVPVFLVGTNGTTTDAGLQVGWSPSPSPSFKIGQFNDDAGYSVAPTTFLTIISGVRNFPSPGALLSVNGTSYSTNTNAAYSTTPSAPTGSLASTNAPLIIGAGFSPGASPGGQNWNGNYSECIIYRAALSQAKRFTVENNQANYYGLVAITAHPSTNTQTVSYGGSTTALSVTAATNYSTIASYTWYSNTTNTASGGTVVATHNSAATTDAYTPPATAIGTLYYYVVVTNSQGYNSTSTVSGAVTVTKATPTINSLPSASAITQGQALSSSNLIGGAATGVSGTLAGSFTFTTQSTVPSSSGTYSAAITFTPTDGTNYTNATANVNVTVNASGANTCPGSTAVTPTASQSVCVGTSASQLTAAISNGGTVGSPTLQYQWYYNITNSNTISGATIVSGATNSTYTPLSTAAEVGTRYYFCVGYATDNSCGQSNSTQSLASNAVQVTVNAIPSAPTGTATQSFCSGASPTVANLTATGSSLIWYTTAGGATVASGSLVDGTTYYVSQTVSNCESSARFAVLATVNITPSVTTANTASVCSGGTTNISLTASAASTFAWTLGTNTGSITGATASNGSSISQALINPSNSTAGSVVYSVTPTSTIGSCVGNATDITVTVNPTPTISNATTASICSGSSPALSLTASATSTFAWTLGTNTGSITGATATSGSSIAQTLTNPSNSTAGSVVYAVTPTSNSGTCVGSATNVTITVNPAPTITNATTASTCSGTSPALSLTASVASSFAWTLGTNTGSITGATASSGSSINQSLTNPSNSTAGSVVYVVTPTATTGSCVGSPANVTVTVNPAPAAPTGSTPQTFCGSGTVAGLLATGSNILWYAAINGGVALSTSTALVNGTIYYASQTVGGCESSSSNSSRLAVTASISATPSVPSASAATSVSCTGFNANWAQSSCATKYYLDVYTTSSNIINEDFETGLNGQSTGYATGGAALSLGSGSWTFNNSGLYNTTTIYSGSYSCQIKNSISAYAATPSITSCGVITFWWNSPTAPTVKYGTTIYPTTQIASSGSEYQFSATVNSSSANVVSFYNTAGLTGYLDLVAISPYPGITYIINNKDVGNVTTYSVTGLTAATAYNYVVRAYDGTNTSASSSVISQTTSTAPTITTTGTVTGLSYSANSQSATLNYTATTNTPTAYSIVWNAAAHTAGFADQTSTTTTFATGSGSITSIAIPAGLADGTYSGTMTITNAGGCTATKAISFTLTAIPTIALSTNNIAAGNIIQNTTNNPLYSFAIGVTTASATLTGLTVTTTGTYASADVTNLKAWYQTSATFNSSTATLLSTLTTPGVAGSKVFPSFTANQTIANGTTGYIFITADIPCAATTSNTITINAVTASNTSFSLGTPTGTPAAGNTQTVAAATPVNVTSPAASVSSASSVLTWTNPTGCYSEVLIVASPAANTGGTPTGDGTAFTANLAYGSGTAFGNGFVVYKGATSSQTITGLTNGSTYYYKMFTRLGTSWSAGTEVSATPNLVYCLSTGTTNASSTYFTSFSTTGGTTNVSNTSSGYSSNGYGDFTATQAVTQAQGATVNFSTTIFGVTGQVGVAIFVDWNQNGVFTDAGENVYNTNGTYAISSPTGSFVVPSTATVGNTRMRIVVDFNSSTPVSCNSGITGETEDYKFTVSAPTNYYLKAGADPTDKTQWGTNTDGTGANPSSISISGAIWNVTQNGNSATTWATTWSPVSPIVIANSTTFTVPKALTLASGTTFTIGTSALTAVTATGSIVDNGASITGASASTLTFAANASYTNAANGGTIPTASWNASSTCNITGITSTVPSGLSQSFGNFTWNCTSQAYTSYINTSLFATSGTLSVVNTGTAALALSYSTSNSYTNSFGSISVGAFGLLEFTYSSTGMQTVKVSGDLTVSAGGVLYLNYQSTPTIGTYGATLLLGGNLSVASTSYFTCNTSYAEVIFNKSGSQTYSNASTDITGSNRLVDYAVAPSSTLVLNSNLSLYSSSSSSSVWDALYVNGTLNTGANIVNADNGSYTVFQLAGNTSTSISFTTTNGSCSVTTAGSTSGLVRGMLVTGTGIPANTYLVDILSSTSLQLSNTATSSATNSLTFVSSGSIITSNANGIQSAGTIGAIQTSAANISLSSTANYEFDGAATGVFTTTPTLNTVNNLTINSSGTTLSQPMTVTGTARLTAGILTTTSSNLLTIANPLNSGISGGSSSSYINGPASWKLGTTSTGSYTVPVGASGNYYPLAFAVATNGIASGSPTITVTPNATGAGSADGSTLTSTSGAEYWKVVTTGSAFSATSFSLGRSTPTLGNINAIGISTTNAATSYVSIGGTVGTLSSQPSVNTSSSGYSGAGTLYLALAQTQVTVTFNSNGGSSVTAINTGYNTTITLPTAPTLTGYTFGGWFTDNTTFTNAFTASTTVTANITVYAKWIANTYTVTFNNNGGSGSMSNQNFTYGAAATALTTSTFTRTGYTFAGWNTAANGSGTSYTDGQSYSIGTANVTLYAKWTCNTGTWVGGASGTPNAWANASNWCGASVPIGTTDVTIPVTSNNPSIVGSSPVNNLTVAPGASLTVTGTLQVAGSMTNNGTLDLTAGTLELNGTSAAQTIQGSAFSGNTISGLKINNSNGVTIGSQLNITGIVTPTAGTLTTGGYLSLKSTATSTARIAQGATNGGYISGNVTVERYIPAKTTRKFIQLGSAVSGVTIANSWQQQIYITGAGTGGTLCGTTNSNGFDATATNQASMFTYAANKGSNNSHWTSVPNTNGTNLIPGVGYDVNIRGNRNNCAQLSSTTPPSPDAVTLSASGTVSQGNVSVPLNQTTGANNSFTLVANPYPCPIDFDNFRADNNNSTTGITGTMWLYSTNTTAGGGFTPGNYTTYNGGITVNAPTGYTSLNLLESGQAFFVQSLSSSANSVTFKEAHKTTGTPLNSAYFGSVLPKMIRVGLQTTGNSSLDEVVIRFNSNGSQAYNPAYDAVSLNAGNQILAVLKGTNRLAISTLLDSTAADSAKLGVKSVSTGTFQLVFSQFNGIDSSKTITLVDKYLDSTMDIRMNQVYVFNITSDTASSGNNRFEVLFGAASNPLPVNFTGVTANKKGADVEVKWTVANQLNIASYKVERSTDGSTFTSIATTKATGANTYTLEDKNLPVTATTLYYRIKAIGNDGTTRYSNVAKLTTNHLPLTTIAIYPNPVQDKLNISLGTATNGNYTVRVLSVTGAEAIKKSGLAANGNTISLDATQLATGFYMVELTDEAGNKQLEKFVKR